MFDHFTNIIVQILLRLTAPATPAVVVMKDLFQGFPLPTLFEKTILLLMMEVVVFVSICILTPLVLTADLGGIFSGKISLQVVGRKIPAALNFPLAIAYGLFLFVAALSVAWQWKGLDFVSGTGLLVLWSATTAVPVGAVFLSGYDRYGALILGAGAACVAGTVLAGIAIGFCLAPFSIPLRPYLISAGALPLIPLLFIKRLPRKYDRLAIPVAVALPAVAVIGFAFADLIRLSNSGAMNSWDAAAQMAVKITFGFITFNIKIQRYIW